MHLSLAEQGRFCDLKPSSPDACCAMHQTLFFIFRPWPVKVKESGWTLIYST